MHLHSLPEKACADLKINFLSIDGIFFAITVGYL